jgi:hypothetical protein
MKLKLYRSIIFALVCVYVFANAGVSVISHYCGGELQEVAVFSEPDSCCGEEEEAEVEGCCKNETKHFSYQNDFTFNIVKTDVKLPMLLLPIVTSSNEFSSLIGFVKTLTKQINHPPPDIVQHDIVSVSVLRI